MSNQFFEVAVRYDKTMENGVVELDTVAETKYMDYIRYNSNGQ